MEISEKTKAKLLETLKIVASAKAVYVELHRADYEDMEGRSRQCRRDDLITLAWMGLVFLDGKYPWGVSKVYLTDAGKQTLDQ